MATEKANPMSFWTKLGFGAGGIAAFFGRRPLIANYERTVQYGTDMYIRAWKAILLMFGVVALNAFFMWMGWHGAQITLLLVSFAVGLYYVFAPAIAVPLVGLATAIRAGESGDQVNIWLVRDGLKDLVNNVGVVFFWIGIYILATIIVPFGLYLSLFLFGHAIIVLMLALIMSGKVEMSNKVYQVAWKSCVVTLIGGLLTVMMFREQLGPWWTEHTASRAAQVDAEQRTEAIRAIDEAHAEWLKKHVRMTEDGHQVITVVGADGQKKTVDAAPYKARRQQERDAAIASLGGGKGASAVAMGAGGLLGGHLLYLILFGGLGLGGVAYAMKKKDGTTTTESKVLGNLVLLALLGGGGYWALNTDTVANWTGRDGSDVVTSAVVPPSMTDLNRANFTAHFDYLYPTFANLPQYMWDKKDIEITDGCTISLTSGMHCMLAFGEGNRSLDLYLAEGKCAKTSGRVPYVCEGTWRTTRYEGYFRGEWNPQGTVFVVRLCGGDARNKTCNTVGKITFVNVPKDNR